MAIFPELFCDQRNGMGDGGICKMHLIIMVMVTAMQKLNPGIGNSWNVQKGTYKREEGGTKKKGAEEKER